jgi:hypothetical protein
MRRHRRPRRHGDPRLAGRLIVSSGGHLPPTVRQPGRRDPAHSRLLDLARATHEEADRITNDIGTIRDIASSAPSELAAPLTVVADETETLVESIGGKARDRTRFQAAGAEVSGICRPLVS